MDGVADESKIQRRRADPQLKARKERLRTVTSTAQDIAIEEKLLIKSASYKTRDADI